MPTSAPAAPRPSPRPGRRSLVLLAALLASAPALAVQLPKALLAEPAPLSLQPPPPLRPLAGLDGWRLYSVFSRGDGQGTASLSLDDTTLLTVQAGVRLPGGIEVLEVQRDRLLLRRGAQVGVLVIRGRASRVAELSPGTVVAERAPVLPTLPAGCESFAQAGVPLDELQALGGCPQVNAP